MIKIFRWGLAISAAGMLTACGGGETNADPVQDTATSGDTEPAIEEAVEPVVTYEDAISTTDLANHI